MLVQKLSQNHLDKPGLLLYILDDVNFFVRIVEPSVRGLEFFKQDGRLWDRRYWQLSTSDKRAAHFLTIGASSGVEVKRGVARHCRIRFVECAYDCTKSG